MENKLLVPDIGDFEKVEIIEILVKVGDAIKKNDSLDMVLQKAYNYQVKQAVQIIRSLSRDPNKLIKMVKNNKKIKWSKKIKKRNILNKFYEINKNISKNNLKKKIRATVTKKFKPYIKIHGIKFTYTN